MTRLKKFLSNGRGATAVEYGIIAALVAAVAVAGFTALGGKVGDTSTAVADKIVVPA